MTRPSDHATTKRWYNQLIGWYEIGDEDGQQMVSKWTKNVDIFQKDFIFVPINQE